MSKKIYVRCAIQWWLSTIWYLTGYIEWTLSTEPSRLSNTHLNCFEDKKMIKIYVFWSEHSGNTTFHASSFLFNFKIRATQESTNSFTHLFWNYFIWWLWISLLLLLFGSGCTLIKYDYVECTHRNPLHNFNQTQNNETIYR